MLLAASWSYGRRGLFAGFVAGMPCSKLHPGRYYAQQDARTPLYLAALNAAVYVAAAVNFSGRLGAVGIALANSFAFTLEAVLLLIILQRRFPGVLAVRGSLIRALAGGLAGAALTYIIIQAPLPSLVASLGAMAAGGLLALPFIFPEIRILLKL